MAVTQGKILAFGRLVKDSSGKYWFYDVNRSGLYFDLSMLMRKSNENEQGFNDRINEAYTALQAVDDAANSEVVYKPTLGLTAKQAAALPASWRAIFSEKSYFFLYDDSLTSLSIGSNIPNYGEMYADFVWMKDDLVWTWMSSDRLGFQYPRTLTISGATTATGGTSTGTSTTGSTTDDTSTELTAILSNAKISVDLTGNFMGNPFNVSGTVKIEPIEEE